MIVKNCVRSMRVVAGGGATEMEISRMLKETSRGIEGKQQLVMLAYARALELIPRQLADNAGFDATDILNRLRQKHASSAECVFLLFFSLLFLWAFHYFTPLFSFPITF